MRTPNARCSARRSESSFDVAIPAHPRPRGDDGGGDAAVTVCILGVFWVGAHDVVAGRMSVGLLTQFAGYAVIFVSGTGALSETWGDLQRAAGASERLMELLHVTPAVAAPEHPVAISEAGAGRGGVQGRDVPLSGAARFRRAQRFLAVDRAGRSGGAGGAFGRGQVHRVPASAALLCAAIGRDHL